MLFRQREWFYTPLVIIPFKITNGNLSTRHFIYMDRITTILGPICIVPDSSFKPLKIIFICHLSDSTGPGECMDWTKEGASMKRSLENTSRLLMSILVKYILWLFCPWYVHPSVVVQLWFLYPWSQHPYLSPPFLNDRLLLFGTIVVYCRLLWPVCL